MGHPVRYVAIKNEKLLYNDLYILCFVFSHTEFVFSLFNSFHSRCSVLTHKKILNLLLLLFDRSTFEIPVHTHNQTVWHWHLKISKKNVCLWIKRGISFKEIHREYFTINPVIMRFTLILAFVMLCEFTS